MRAFTTRTGRAARGQCINMGRTLTPPQVRPIQLISCGYSAWQRSQRLHLSRPLIKRRKPYWIKRFDQRRRGSTLRAILQLVLPMTGGSACGEARYAVTAQPIFGYDLPLHDLPEENWQRLLNERAGSTPEFRPQAVKDDNSLPEDRDRERRQAALLRRLSGALTHGTSRAFSGRATPHTVTGNNRTNDSESFQPEQKLSQL